MSATSTAFSLLADHTEDYAWFPDAASTFAEDVDWLFGFISLVGFLFFIPIAISLFYFAWKYHKPKGELAESNVSHNTPLELAWSIGPSFFLVGMFVLGAKAYLDHRTVPDGANELGVQAFSWGWTINYGGGTMHPELHILLDEPTKLSMRSSDVIHSLYIPAFRAKKDIVPGRYNYMWFDPAVASTKVSDEELQAALDETKKSGEEWDYERWGFTPDGYTFFDLYCTEYCGTNHSEMQTQVVVHEDPDDLNAWIKKYSQRGEGQTLEEYGALLYARRGCSSCHSLDGSKRVGPSFNETWNNERQLASGETIVADENYIEQSIRYPKAKVVAGYQPVMPSYQGQLSEDDLMSLVAFIKSVSEFAPEDTGATSAEGAEDASETAE